MTEFKKLRVLKGAEMFCALNGAGPGRYVQIRKGATVVVLNTADNGKDGCAVRLRVQDGARLPHGHAVRVQREKARAQ